MRLYTCLLVYVTFLAWSHVTALDPTLYQYYTSGGIKTGLEANHADHFTLNGKPYIIYGGSLHYFRVVPQYWRPILQRFKAAGLNAVQLYLPWNLHEQTPGHFDFESPQLQLAKFLEEVKLADMFAIVRPGPYICAEWEFGGFPSWLLRDPQMKLRSAYKPYLDRVKLYWHEAMKIINRYQFSTTGGPVIMLQIENEYFGAFWMEHSADYLRYLLNITRASGFKELVFTSDPGFAAKQLPTKNIFNNTHDQVLETANFNTDSLATLTELKKKQPNKPAYVSEFWPGWFDSWNETKHHVYSVEQFDKEISDTLFQVNGSVNFYMFIGGTNFGFMNGARIVTSYDYDAPLSESGNYTAKYHKTRELYHKLVSTGRLPKTYLPPLPPVQQAHAYGTIKVEEMLSLEQMLAHAHKYSGVKKPVSMELLNEGSDYGQRFGFILYRVEGLQINTYEVSGPIADQAIFMVSGAPYNKTVVTEDGMPWLVQVITYPIRANDTVYKYDLLVENMGRNNDGDKLNEQRKGILSGDIKLNGVAVNNITIYSLDFAKPFMDKISSEAWSKLVVSEVPFPAMYRAVLKVQGQPQDTYIRLDGWTKGNVFVNGFNLGRYWKVGPQKTLYIPAPLLKSGDNAIELFELHSPGQELHFLDHPVLE